MQKTLKAVSFLAILSQLTGCYSPYILKPEDKAASVKLLMGNADIKMCRDGKFYSLNIDPKTGYALIPAGRRVAFLMSATYSTYPYTYSCHPRIGFSPKEGDTYIADMNIIDSRCLIEVVKQNNNVPSSVEIEPSVGPADCFRQ